MDILNNSIVDTVIEYANVKFGVELDKDALASNLKQLSYSEVLGLVDAIKDEDDDKFTNYIDLSAVNEGYKIMPPMDPKYAERDGLEGPFTTLSGKVVYYDPKEGSYYDPDTDMYLSYEEFQKYDTDYSGMKEAITPQSAQGAMSAASLRASRNGNDQRDAVNAQQDAQRDATAAVRTVAGANKQPTSQIQKSRGPLPQDPDDLQRAQNAQATNQTAQRANINSQEIERLKQLVQGRR